ncbi:MAG: hypothetical protein JO108_06725 [Acidobacteriaceae bacterium]|nr:hypothetical protein [Acidobacteriaceae bacterium]
MRLSGNGQCTCAVYAEGKLPRGGYQRPKSTAVTHFRAGAPNGPAQGCGTGRAVAKATSGIAAHRRRCGRGLHPGVPGTSVTSERMLQFEHLLELRLIPFVATKRIEYIQEIYNAEIWGQFRPS